MYRELFMTSDKISGKRQTLAGVFDDFAKKLAESTTITAPTMEPARILRYRTRCTIFL